MNMNLIDCSLCDFHRYVSLKEYFEFGVYCIERDGRNFESLKEFKDAFYYEETEHEELELMNDKYMSFLKDYMTERGIIWDETEDYDYEDSDYYCDRENFIFYSVSMLSYLFVLYNIDISFLELDSLTWGYGWCYEFLSTLGMELTQSFLKEWDKLKVSDLNNEILQRADLLGVGLKDSFYNLRTDVCVDWDWDNDKGFLECKDETEMRSYFRTCNFYEHDGLFINRKFIDDNEQLIDRDELLDWCEYILNKTFRDLGLRYNKEKIEKFELEEEQETELEQEIAR